MRRLRGARVRILLIAVCGIVLTAVLVTAGMLILGTSDPPPPLASIGRPFQGVDFSDLPKVERIPARAGAPIAFRHWPIEPASAGAERAVVALHGSSATGSSLHPLAKALRAEGIPVYAPDIRGHGETGRRGDIDHAGQLDDDLADLVAEVRKRQASAKLVLLGFSSGGGFALRAAASPLGTAFHRAVLLSPMLGPRAPTVRSRGDAWAKPFIPRIIALVMLNRIGIHTFDHLPALAFAIQPERAELLTGSYSWRLMRAFGTNDYAADLRKAAMPIDVLVGEQDELFDARLFAPTIAAVRTDIAVTVVPALNHIEMTLDPRAYPGIVAAVRAP